MLYFRRHVTECGKNPNGGSYFTNPNQFDAAHKDLQIEAIKETLYQRNARWKDDEGIRRAVVEAKRLLENSHIKVNYI